MSEVLRVHAIGMARQRTAFFLVIMFCGMSLVPFANANSPSRQVDVNVGLGPNGMSDQFKVEIPDGEIVTDLSLKIHENTWPVKEIQTWDDKSDWSNGVIMDGIDYNVTGLRVLPMSHEWDFEGSTQGWNLNSAGGWAHGYDSTLGSVNGVHSGTSAIYTYNGNYPNNMGGPYWATSPTIDCSACSGTWDLKFWKRLGVESSSYDHAYVSVKTSSGGWTNVYSNPYGSTNDGSYTQSSYDVSNHISGNSAFQVRFGLGTTDSSVTYTGWNIDDVVLEPRGNTGTGMANWTSQSFGPNGALQMQHGMMSIDATKTLGSMIRWSLIDSANGTFIPGFIDREDMQADLSVIDTNSHPSVQIKIQMESTGESPVINSITLGGGIVESFSENPTSNGWSGFSSHSNGIVTGNGMLSSPEWRLVNPFSYLEMSWVGTGSGNFQVCFESSSCTSSGWIDVPSDGKLSLENPSVHLSARWSGSGSYTMDHISIHLHRQSSPMDARIDVGLDGVSEWKFSHDAVGPWGFQNLFENGHSSINASVSAGSYDSISLYYPYKSGQSTSGTSSAHYESSGNLMLSLTPQNAPLTDVVISFSIAGTEFVSQNIGFLSEPYQVALNDNQMQDLINAMDARTAEENIVGHLDAHLIEIVVSSSSGGELFASGLSIPYHYEAEISGDISSPIISAINSQLSQTSAHSGTKVVSIPFVMTNPGSLEIWDYGLQTLGSPEPISMVMSNQTDTLVAGNDWYEFNSTFDLSNIGVADASSHFASESWSSVFTLGGTEWSKSVYCSITTESCNSDQGIIIEDFSYLFTGSQVEFFHRIQISSIWPDEEAVIASSSIDMNGPASQPSQIRFGAGWSMGVEQDVDVIDWHLSFMNGAQSTWDALYFDPANPGIVEVNLAFEDLEDSPRSSSFNVALYLDGILTDTTQVIEDGAARLMFTPNALASEIDLEVSVSGLYGQEVNWKVPKNATFLMDDLAPILLDSNIAPLDHRSNDRPLELTFEIGDRPVLPHHALLHVETSWNGEETIQLDLPSNLNDIQGEYSSIVDVRDASIGDTMSGWLEVFDPAGHALPDSGSEENPLFIIRFGPDGAPTIMEDGLGWNHADNWLHPGQNYSMKIPIQDVNGYGDIESVVVDLSSDSSENLEIDWSAVDGCSSSTSTIIIQDCFIVGDANHFDAMFTLEIVMSFAWDFNPDSSLERRVRVTASDDSGQSYRSELESSWRYSSEMEIDTSSVEFSGSSAFVAPGQTSTISADVIWTKGGQPVDTIVDIIAHIDSMQQYGISENGSAEILLTAPNNTGIHPITVDLVNLPAGGIDRTDSETVVAWMVVDANAPKVVQFLSPDPLDLVQERDWKDLGFEIMVNESEGLDIESLRMHWLIVPHGMAIPELALLGGNVSMELIAGTGAGNSIPLLATLDVDSIIPEVSRENSWDLWVWVEGQDLAGQDIESSFNSRSSPLAVLQLANREADMRIESSEIVIPNQYPSTGDIVWVNVTVHNDGQVDGSTSVRVEVVEDGDQRRLIEIINIDVPASSSVSFEAKWIPEDSGASWIEVTTPSGLFERTSPIQVDEGESDYVIEGLEGASSSMLTGFSVITLLMVGLLGYLIISGKKKSSSNSEHDEYF